MLKLVMCEFAKLKRKPFVFLSLLLSVLMPLAYAFFLADAKTSVDAVNGIMSSLFQLSAYLLLMPFLVILASNLLFEELDCDILKNLLTVPVNRTKLVLSKMFHWVYGGWRIGKFCSFTVSRLETCGVLDIVFGRT